MDKYVIDTFGKVNKDTKLTLLSDCHFNEKTNNRKILKLLDKLEKEEPNYIFLLGDVINDTKMGNEVMNTVEFYLNVMASIAPVYLIYGNHDIMTKIGDGNWVKYRSKEYISMLNSIKDLKLLDNDSVILPENISLTGVTLPLEYYQKYFESNLMYLIYLKEHINNGMFNTLNNELYNIFLCHSPNSIFDKKTYLKLLKMIREKVTDDVNFDLILSGHLHNGLVPSYMDKLIPGNRGLVGINGPKVKLFKDNCRGITDISENTKGIILPAITSLVAHPVLNKFYPSDYKTLVLKK